MHPWKSYDRAKARDYVDITRRAGYRMVPLGAALHLTYELRPVGGTFSHSQERDYWQKQVHLGRAKPVSESGYSTKGASCYELVPQFHHRVEREKFAPPKSKHKPGPKPKPKPKPQPMDRWADFREKERFDQQVKEATRIIEDKRWAACMQPGVRMSLPEPTIEWIDVRHPRTGAILYRHVWSMSDNAVYIFELHGREYIFHKLSATKACVLLTRLSRLFGDTFVRLLLGTAGKTKSATEDGKTKPVTEEVTQQALDTLAQKLQVFEKLKDDDILDLARLVLPYVWIGNNRIYTGNDVDIDQKFQGYELDLLPVVWEAVKYNLGPLMEGFRLRMQDASILKSMSISQ